MKITKLYVFLWIVGLCIASAGIAVELTMKANIGFVLITAGSVVVAGGSIIYAKLVRGGKR